MNAILSAMAPSDYSKLMIYSMQSDGLLPFLALSWEIGLAFTHFLHTRGIHSLTEIHFKRVANEIKLHKKKETNRTSIKNARTHTDRGREREKKQNDASAILFYAMCKQKSAR